MKEREWSGLLNAFKEHELSSLTRLPDEVFEKGLQQIRQFLTLVLDTPKRPLEKHQFDVLINYLPIVFKEAFGKWYWEANMDELSSKCNLVHTKQIVLVVIKRQHGKSEIMARLAAASMVCFNNKESDFTANSWLIFSHKGLHACENLNRIKCHVMSYKRRWRDNFTFKCNQKALRLKSISGDKDDIREAIVYTGNLDGLGGKKGFFDEFGQNSEHRVAVQFVPQLQVKGVSFLLATSLKAYNPWLSKWIDPKKNILTAIVNHTEICEECLKKECYEESMKCQHKRRLQAHFVDPDSTKGCIKLMPPAIAMREMANAMPNVRGQIWREDYLREKLSIIGYDGDQYEHYFFVDPSMTSPDGSRSGSTGMSYAKNKFFVKYLNHEHTSSNTQIVNYVIKDLEYFFKLFPKTRVYLFVESNTVNHGEEICRELDHVDRKWLQRGKVVFVKGIKQGKRYGVTKKKMTTYYLHKY